MQGSDRRPPRVRRAAALRGLRRRPRLRLRRPARELPRHEGERHEIECDFIAGCDGFHGVCRPSIPDGVLTTFDREYPFGWLGILARVAPSMDELDLLAPRARIRASVDALARGHAPVPRGADPARNRGLVRRAHLGGAPDAASAAPAGRSTRARSSRRRSRDAQLRLEPMQYEPPVPGRRRGAHRPATGAKGLNLAVADVCVLAQALTDWLQDDDDSGLEAYSETCLQRVWRVQHFSWWMTSMLHRFPDEDEIQARLQRASWTTSRAREPRRRCWPRTTPGCRTHDGRHVEYDV